MSRCDAPRPAGRNELVNHNRRRIESSKIADKDGRGNSTGWFPSSKSHIVPWIFVTDYYLPDLSAKTRRLVGAQSIALRESLRLLAEQCSALRLLTSFAEAPCFPEFSFADSRMKISLNSICFRWLSLRNVI
jgi:hypothetical protein